MPVVELVSQIDVDHFTVRFVDGDWKDKFGDYRIMNPDPKFDPGQRHEVEVGHYPKFKEPSMNGYCGRLVMKGIVKEEAHEKAKKVKK